MTGKARQSLTEFAASRGNHHGAGPWFKTLPQEVQDEVVTAWEQGMRGVVIIEWLRSLGYEDATKGRVTGYLGTLRG